VRLVLSRALDVSLDSKLVRTARTVPVWIFTRDGAAVDKAQALEASGVRIFRVPEAAGGLSLRAVLALLADEGVTRLLVEGGASIWRAFAAEGLVDEAVLFQAGQETSSAALAAGLAPGLDLALVARRQVGADTLSVLRARKS
jgi:diaminohydroxyphosphoribosylaminopyrimidine deaminase/5-amino-6-(5-phosphoribosylamino)uracil reductase